MANGVGMFSNKLDGLNHSAVKEMSADGFLSIADENQNFNSVKSGLGGALIKNTPISSSNINEGTKLAS